MKPGVRSISNIVHIVVEEAKERLEDGVKERIKSACDKYNINRRPRSKEVVFNPFTETIVITGVINHYESVLNDLGWIAS